jgi:RNA polymerase sigma-70 factor (ECF subfamily)
MLLNESRRKARTDSEGCLVTLRDQDRSTWDRELIREGHEVVRACIRRNQPGPYQLQAAIAAVHADAGSADETDWDQIVTIYDQLSVMAPTPVVRLNRAIAIAETGDVEGALNILDGLDLDGYHLYHATYADLLERLGRFEDAADSYARALDLTTNEAERAHLERREQRARGGA